MTTAERYVEVTMGHVVAVPIPVRRTFHGSDGRSRTWYSEAFRWDRYDGRRRLVSSETTGPLVWWTFQ